MISQQSMTTRAGSSSCSSYCTQPSPSSLTLSRHPDPPRDLTRRGGRHGEALSRKAGAAERA